jgi:methionine-rich copper-binding protein CopC
MSGPHPAVRLLGGALATAALLLGPGATAASAHDRLVGITPAGDVPVATSPAHVAVELTRPPQALGTQVVVSGPDGGQASEGAVELRGTTVIQPLRDDLPAGTYTVQWRVTSADGHPLAGTSTFAVAAGGSPGTAPPGGDNSVLSEAADARPAAPDAGGLPSPVIWTAVGAILVAAAGMAVRRRRGRA